MLWITIFGVLMVNAGGLMVDYLDFFWGFVPLVVNFLRWMFGMLGVCFVVIL